MNQKTPPSAAAFMLATVAAALAVGLWAGWNSGFPLNQLAAFCVLATLGALAHLYPIRSAQTNVATYVVANTFLFAGVLMLDAGWLALL
ncbi:MAG TPA: hypothetical protein VD902_07070, partial [Symbiobacteriaceae bacterium]|nr:hypothetical protein [Symbiobacteriaceae bacterium]